MCLVDSSIAFIQIRDVISVLYYKRNDTQGLITHSKEKLKLRWRPRSENTGGIKSPVECRNKTTIKCKQLNYIVSTDIWL